VFDPIKIKGFRCANEDLGHSAPNEAAVDAAEALSVHFRGDRFIIAQRGELRPFRREVRAA
jgi:hypothetical protein